MIPLPRFIKRCQEQFVIDEEYPLTMLDARSRESHSHYFACVAEGFRNLPEGHQFNSSTELRKFCLVKAGYVESTAVYVCDSDDLALELASKIKRNRGDDYIVIVIKANIVKVYEAKSQSAAAMGRDIFQASKTDVLDQISDLIGVTV